MRVDPFDNPRESIRRVYAYVAYRVGVGADADDITGETFARALRYRDSFDPRSGDAAAWLIGIARRCIADAALKGDVLSEELPETEVACHDDSAHARIDLAAAVAGLDSRDRELVALRYGGDLTAGQIAEIMRMKPNAVEVALHRALGRLRMMLAEDVGGRRSADPATRPAATDPSAS